MKKSTRFAVCAAVVTCALVFVNGCFTMNMKMGNGKAQTKNFPLDGFNTVALSGGWTVEVVQSTDFAVKITLDSNLFDYLDVYVSGTTLHIAPKEFCHFNGTVRKVFIAMPSLSKLEASGWVKGTVSGFSDSTNDLVLDISGAGTFTADIIVRKLTVTAAGSGKFELAGEAKDVSADISGAGTIHARNLKAENANISISGTGYAEVWAEKKLKAAISGAGKIRYKGSPQLSTSMSGAGSIKSLE